MSTYTLLLPKWKDDPDCLRAQARAPGELMVLGKFLYNYLVIDEENGRPIAEYDSDAAPPAVGSIIDLEDMVTKGLHNRFKVLVVELAPLKGDAALLTSKVTHIKLIVKRAE
jgi:hypothetical protein